MEFFKHIVGLLFAMLLVSCIAPPGQDPATGPVPTGGVSSNTNDDNTNRVTIDRSEEEYLKRKVKDLEARLARLQDFDDNNRRNTRDTRKREDCEGDRDCEEICKDIYDRRSDRADCEELSVASVERLEDVYNYLEDPDDDDLGSVDPVDLNALIDISIEPIDDIFGDYGSRDAKTVATWIAENPDIAEIFADEDDEDFDLFEAIFREIGSNTAVSGLERNLSGGDNFIDIVVQEDNQEALEWVHSYFEDNLCDNEDESELCVLNQYCGLDVDGDTEEDLLELEEFEEFLDDLISDANDGSLTHSSDFANIKRCPVTLEYILEENGCTAVSGESPANSDYIAEFFGADNSKVENCSREHDDTNLDCDQSFISGNKYWINSRDADRDNLEDSDDLDDWKQEICGN